MKLNPLKWKCLFVACAALIPASAMTQASPPQAVLAATAQVPPPQPAPATMAQVPPPQPAPATINAAPVKVNPMAAFELALAEYNQAYTNLVEMPRDRMAIQNMANARENLIRRTIWLPQMPAIPEAARMHEIMGQTFFKDAKTPGDFAQVGKEYDEAIHLAPWWAEARYNEAKLYEAEGAYVYAVAALKLCLLFRLPAAEVRSLQDEVYVCEAKAEESANNQAVNQQAQAANQAREQQAAAAVSAAAQAQAAAATAEAAARAEKQREYYDKIGWLAGTWNFSTRTYFGNGSEYTAGAATGQLPLTITGNKIVVMRGPYVALKGIIQGDDYTSIQWFIQASDSVKQQGGNFPDYQVSVTVDKAGSRISWQQPMPLVTVGWSWNGHTEYQMWR